jgi:hypothetical protein
MYKRCKNFNLTELMFWKFQASVRSGNKKRPNAWRISRAAPVDRNCGFADTAAKIAPILGPRSGVGLHALVGRHHAGGPR